MLFVFTFLWRKMNTTCHISMLNMKVAQAASLETAQVKRLL